MLGNVLSALCVWIRLVFLKTPWEKYCCYHLLLTDIEMEEQKVQVTWENHVSSKLWPQDAKFGFGDHALNSVLYYTWIIDCVMLIKRFQSLTLLGQYTDTCLDWTTAETV